MGYNCTITNTTETIDFTRSMFITINVLLMVSICGGNTLTIVAVWRTYALRIVPNVYVVSLAAADLLAGIFIPLNIVIFIPSVNTIIDDNKYFCVTRQAAFFMSVCASVFSMVSIAFDRAFFIKYPLHYERLVTMSKAKFIIACIWIASIAVGTMPLYYNNWKPCKECSMFIVIKKEFQVYIILPLFILCCIMTIGCYGYILHVAVRHRREIDKLETDPSKRNQTAKDMKLVKLFVLVFGIFFVCWVPTLIAVTIGHLGGNVPRIITSITVSISVLNSSMNFVVYAVKNKDFRRAFIKMLCPKNCVGSANDKR